MVTKPRRATDRFATPPPMPGSVLFAGPEPPRRRARGVVAASLAAHVVLLGLAMLGLHRAAGRALPEEPVPMTFLLTPPPPASLTPPPVVKPFVRPPRPEPPAREAPVAALPPAPLPEPKPPEPPRSPERPEPRPALPAPQVRKDLFPVPEPVRPAEVAERREARTGLFGESEPGTAPQGAATALLASARVGGFEVPAAQASGGNGRVARDERRVSTSGFASDSPSPSRAAPSRDRTAVRPAAFGEPLPAESATRARPKPVETLDRAVEVVSKPKPVYTAKARTLRLEGEVALEVVFEASGRLRVIRVLRGLGHGLDEAAVEAAEKIVFNPAHRDGRPVDYTATLRVVFQLA